MALPRLHDCTSRISFEVLLAALVTVVALRLPWPSLASQNPQHGAPYRRHFQHIVSLRRSLQVIQLDRVLKEAECSKREWQRSPLCVHARR